MRDDPIERKFSNKGLEASVYEELSPFEVKRLYICKWCGRTFSRRSDDTITCSTYCMRRHTKKLRVIREIISGFDEERKVDLFNESPYMLGVGCDKAYPISKNRQQAKTKKEIQKDLNTFFKTETTDEDEED